MQQKLNSIAPATRIKKQSYSRRMKIPRHKIPNLSVNGDKFDHPNIVFFGKISNSFKLLEKYPNQKQYISQNIRTEQRNSLLQKNILSSRINKLSEPKNIKNSLNIQSSAKNPQKNHRTQTSTMHNFWQGQHKDKNEKLLPKSHSFSTKQSDNISNSITGTNIGALPLQQILAIRQARQQQKFRNILKKTKINPDDEQQEYPEQNEKQMLYSNKLKKLQDLSPIKDDFVKWSQKIIHGQDELYDIYDRSLMEKIKLYRRKQFKMSHKSMWK